MVDGLRQTGATYEAADYRVADMFGHTGGGTGVPDATSGAVPGTISAALDRHGPP